MNEEFTTPNNPIPENEVPEQENITAAQEDMTGAEELVIEDEISAEEPVEETIEVQPVADETPVVEAEKVSEPEPQQSYTNAQYHYAPHSANFNPNPQPTYYYPSQNQQTAPQTPKKDRKGLRVFAYCVAIALVFALGFGVASISKSDDGKISSSDNREKYEDGPELNIKDSPVSPTAAPAKGALTTAQIAAKVKPSIVGIVVYAQNNRNSNAGEGTGVIMGEDDSGEYTYIITCAHVISDPGISVRVQTEDGTAYDAEIVGMDTRTDLGVVKIKAKGLPAAEFGNSDSLNVGDSVYAIGNPGGIEFFGSFTGGFVSAIDRPVSSEIGYTMKCIQHDAAINPGNSGGALVNVFGQVIGINSQKIAATDYEGMGFAIPISSAKEIIDDLIAYSYVPNRPKLGITYYPVSASAQYSMIAQIKGLPAGTLIINEISPDSSLANTNVRQYDMIVGVNGKPLTTADVLLEKIDKGKVGDKLTLSICRVNADYSIEEFDIEITLVEDKGDTAPATTTVYYIDPFEFFNQFGY